ncbi:MAG: hypothetical protein R2911_34210 [Caldilineaceae bacterium]
MRVERHALCTITAEDFGHPFCRVAAVKIENADAAGVRSELCECQQNGAKDNDIESK